MNAKNNPLNRAKARIANGQPTALTDDDTFESNCVPAINPLRWNAAQQQRHADLSKLAVELNALGLAARVAHPKIHYMPELLVNDLPLPWALSIEFEEERTHLSTWRTVPNGKERLKIGDKFWRRTLGKTDYKWKEIAEFLFNAYNASVAKARALEAAAAAKRSNADLVADLKAKHGMNHYDDTVCVSYYVSGHRGGHEVVAPEGMVIVKAGNHRLTPEQADKLLTLLASFKKA